MALNIHEEYVRVLITAKNEAAKAYKEAEAQNLGLQSSMVETGKAALSTGLLIGGIGLGAAIGIGTLVKMGADYESVTQGLANNTNMSAASLEQMRRTSLALQSATGQAAADIATGYMYIANHAYEGAAATNILTAATKNAAATNGVASENASALAGILREYNVSQKDLASNTQISVHWMDVLHNAFANSNYTAKQFVEGSKSAIAAASSFSVPISAVTAELAILSEHGFPSVQRASLNWAGMLRSLEAPTGKYLAHLKELGQTSHVDLLGDVSKLQKDGAFLPQFLADLAKATKGNYNEVLGLMPKAYAAVAEALIRNQAQLTKVQSLTTAALKGEMLPGMTGTNEAFAKQQQTLIGQFQDLRGAVDSTAIIIGTAFIPSVNNILRSVNPVISSFNTWAQAHADLLTELAKPIKVPSLDTIQSDVHQVQQLNDALTDLAQGKWVTGLRHVMALSASSIVESFSEFKGSIKLVQDVSTGMYDLGAGNYAAAATAFKSAINDSLPVHVFPAPKVPIVAPPAPPPPAPTMAQLNAQFAHIVPPVFPAGPKTYQPPVPDNLMGWLWSLGGTPPPTLLKPPTPSSSPAAPGSVTHHITVNVQNGAVRVEGGTPSDGTAHGLGETVAQALLEFAQAGMNVTPRVHRTAPGAR